MSRINRCLFFMILLLVISRCTHNPLWGDPDFDDPSQTLTGQVLLSDGATPDHIIVWMKNLDVATTTDANGEFKLSLPAPSAQASGGITEMCRVYFYLANYRVDSLDIALTNGKIMPSSRLYDEENRLRHPVWLMNVAEVDVSISPQTIASGYQGEITIIQTSRVTQTAYPIRFEYAEMHRRQTGFLKSRQDETVYSFVNPEGETNRYVLREFTPTRRDTFYITWPPATDSHYNILPSASIEPGVYEWVPMVYITAGCLPETLQKDMAQVIDRLRLGYLAYPIKIGRATVAIE